MTKNFKFIFLVINALFIYFPINKAIAQIRYSIHAEYLLPFGNIKNNYVLGVNAGLGIKYSFNEQYDVTFNSGYTYVQGFKNEDEYFVYNVRPIAGVPLGAGFRFKPDNLFFIQASGGLVIIMKPESDFGLHYSAGAGIHYKKIEFQVRLMQWNKPEMANFAGFQLSFIF